MGGFIRISKLPEELGKYNISEMLLGLEVPFVEKKIEQASVLPDDDDVYIYTVRVGDVIEIMNKINSRTSLILNVCWQNKKHLFFYSTDVKELSSQEQNWG